MHWQSEGLSAPLDCGCRAPRRRCRSGAEEGDTLTVKGFAKPVRTYSVVGLYDDLAERGKIIRRDQDGLALVIDRDKLTKKGKPRRSRPLRMYFRS